MQVLEVWKRLNYATEAFYFCDDDFLTSETRETQTFLAGHATLIIMAGTMQEFWQHEVPKTKVAVGERINLTFRQITMDATT